MDGLPGLIMCSGIVVAAGREKFKSANYNAQTPVGPTRMGSNRMGVRRLKALNRKLTTDTCLCHQCNLNILIIKTTLMFKLISSITMLILYILIRHSQSAKSNSSALIG